MHPVKSDVFDGMVNLRYDKPAVRCGNSFSQRDLP